MHWGLRGEPPNNRHCGTGLLSIVERLFLSRTIILEVMHYCSGPVVRYLGGIECNVISAISPVNVRLHNPHGWCGEYGKCMVECGIELYMKWMHETLVSNKPFLYRPYLPFLHGNYIYIRTLASLSLLECTFFNPPFPPWATLSDGCSVLQNAILLNYWRHYKTITSCMHNYTN